MSIAETYEEWKRREEVTGAFDWRRSHGGAMDDLTLIRMYQSYVDHINEINVHEVEAQMAVEDAAAAGLPHLETIGGVDVYKNMENAPGVIVHTPSAEELGGITSSKLAGALALAPLGLGITGGLAMANVNGTETATLKPGDAVVLDAAGGIDWKGTLVKLAGAGLGLLIAGAGGAAVGGAIGSLVSSGGGASGSTLVDGIPISGPGVPEPPKNMVAKQWVILTHAIDIGNYYIYFFKLIDGRIMCYNPRGKEWKIWRPKKMIVLSSDPRISMIKKLDRVYNKTMRTLAKKTKALKLAR